jgi:DNA-binding transcriptional regulator YiaG
MQIARDAETLGLLFKAMAHYRCAAVADLARHFGVAAGPPLLEALGIDDDPFARWAEVADLSEALWLRPAWPGAAAVAPPSEAPTDAVHSAIAFSPPEAQDEPATALRALRETVGLTAPQLAAKVGVPIGTVGEWERGTAFPEARQVGQLAQALGVAPEAVRAALPAPGGADAGR